MLTRLRTVIDRRRPRGGSARRTPSIPRRDLQYLFVLTYGRSGSTLLMGVLNSFPGYLIRGENGQAVKHLFAYHQVLSKHRRIQRRALGNKGREPGSSTPEMPWYGVDGYPRRRALADIRRLVVRTVLRPGPDTVVTGFKEIRWDDDDTPEYVAWLRKVFPGARFVVNTRSLDDVATSKWWAHDPQAAQKLAEADALLRGLLDDLGDQAFHMHYDDYAADPGAFAPLCTWLGVPFEADRVSAVLSVPHSY